MSEDPDSRYGSPSTPGDLALVRMPAKRRPIPRKGHTKSRAGCMSCKRRKVKCDEVSPECGPCQRLGLECQYLSAKKKPDSPAPETKLVLSAPLREGPTMFEKDDMRFFRHFLFEAYPPLPIDGFAVWQEVSALSHEYEFLLHAMLGLGASHLGLVSSSQYEKSALQHRVLAMQSLNKVLSSPNLTPAAADAAFGTSLVLAFQSAYMTDGLMDFLTMVRGCFLIGQHSVRDFDASAFKGFAREGYIRKVKDIIKYDASNELLDVTVAEGFCNSVRDLRPQCKPGLETDIMTRMENAASLASTDPGESYRELSYLYDRIGEEPGETFAKFMDPENHVAQLVIMHMLVLDFVMSHKAVEKYWTGNVPRNHSFHKGFEFRRRMSKLWIEQINKRLPEEYRKFAEWPINFARSLHFVYSDPDKFWKPFLLSGGRVTWLTEGKALRAARWPPNSPVITPDTSDAPLALRPARAEGAWQFLRSTDDPNTTGNAASPHKVEIRPELVAWWGPAPQTS